jgi:hypothetical protein
MPRGPARATSRWSRSRSGSEGSARAGDPCIGCGARRSRTRARVVADCCVAGSSLERNDPQHLQPTSACLAPIVVMQMMNVFLCRHPKNSRSRCSKIGPRWRWVRSTGQPARRWSATSSSRTIATTTRSATACRGSTNRCSPAASSAPTFPDWHRLLPAVEDALDIRVRFCEAERPHGSFRAINLKLRPAAWSRRRVHANSFSMP